MSYGVTPQLRAPLQKPGRGCCASSHPARAQGFPKLCVTADRRPPLATLGSADPDGADVVAAAPCNIVRVYELRGHPATESPSAETRQGLLCIFTPCARARFS